MTHPTVSVGEELSKAKGRVFRNSGRELLAWMENDNDLDSLRPLPRFSEIMLAARAQLRDQASPIAQ
jgi:hypothetical protein